MTKSGSILLIEDENPLKEVIEFNLNEEGYSVDAAADGDTGWKQANSNRYNLIILDVMLPGIDGFTLCKKIRLQDTETPILFLTAKNTAADRVEGLKIGGDDYLVKPFNLEELLLRVEKLIRRKPGKTEKSVTDFTFGKNYVNFNNFEVKNYRGEIKQLSKREVTLLKLLIENRNTVLSRDDIIKYVWNEDEFPALRTIDNMILSFRKLFEPNPKGPAFFQSVRGVGYKFSYTS